MPAQWKHHLKSHKDLLTCDTVIPVPLTQNFTTVNKDYKIDNANSAPISVRDWLTTDEKSLTTRKFLAIPEPEKSRQYCSTIFNRKGVVYGAGFEGTRFDEELETW